MANFFVYLVLTLISIIMEPILGSKDYGKSLNGIDHIRELPILATSYTFIPIHRKGDDILYRVSRVGYKGKKAYCGYKISSRNLRDDTFGGVVFLFYTRAMKAFGEIKSVSPMVSFE